MRSRSRLRLAGLALLAALVLAGCGDQASKVLRPLDGDGFSVSLPGKPTRSVQRVPTASGTVTAVSYTSDSSEKAVSLGYTDLPKGVDGDLHAAIAGGAANVGGTVEDERATRHQGFEARDARITGAGKDSGTLFVRAILATRRLYVLQYIAEGGDLATPPEAYADIVRSLRIG